MKNVKRNLIIISLLLILALSIGSISASEDIGVNDGISVDSPNSEMDICSNGLSDFEPIKSTLSDADDNEDLTNEIDNSVLNGIDEIDDDPLANVDAEVEINNLDDSNQENANNQLGASNLGMNVIPVQHTGNDARDIQTAINTAVNGDIIYLGEYHYYIDYAQINVTKQIRIQGELGKTIIDGYGYTFGQDGNNSDGVMMLIDAQNVVLDCVMFNNTDPNKAYTDWDTLYGWAVRISRKNVNVTNCSFIDFNHGIYCSGDNAIIKDCYFTGATTRIMGPYDQGKERGTKAIHLSEASNVLIQGNLFDGPMLDSILLDYDCINTKILNNEFRNNSYSIYLYGYDEVEGGYMGSSGLIANNTFTNCGHFEDASYYGGISFTFLPIICAEQTLLYDLMISENTFNVRNQTLVISGPADYPMYVGGGVTISKNQVNAIDDTVEANTVALFYESAGLTKELTSMIEPIYIIENELFDGMFSAVFASYDAEEEWISYFGDLIVPVNGIATTLVINSHNSVAGRSNKIDFSLFDANSNPLNAQIKVLVNDEVYTVNINDGEGYLILNNVSRGNYTVYAGFGGNLTHYNAIRESNFTVLGKESYLNIEVNNITSGEILDVNVRLFDEYSEGLNATVYITLNNTVYEVNTTNGLATLRIQGIIKEGNYTIYGVFDGDNIYLGSNKSANFTVKPTDSYLYLSANNIVSGNPVSLNINLTDLHGNLLNGTVYVKSNGRTYQVSIVKGKGSIRLDGLVEIGNYTITADYLGDGSQVSSSSSIIVEVYGRETTNSINLVKRGEGLYDANIVLNSNSKPISGIVSLFINGKIYDNVFVKDGNALVVLENVFEIGENNVSINYYGDSIYLPSSSSTILSYMDNAVVVTHTGNDQIDLQNAIDIAKPGDIIYLGDYDYSNVSGLIISKDLSFIGNGASISSFEDKFNNSLFIIDNDDVSLNISNVQFKLNNDDKVIFADISENSNIALKLTENAFNKLNDEVDAESISVVSIVSDSDKVDLSAIDITGNVLDSGIAVLSLLNANPVVSRQATVIDYKNMTTTAVDTASDGRIGEYFIITLKDSNGKALANKHVQIGFNGVVYDRDTDDKGQAKLQINLKAVGTYTFAVAFLGDDNYNGSFVVAKIVVNKQKGSLTVPAKSYKASASTKTLTATFKSAKGNPVKGKKVTFTVNGKTYTATTNANGVASVKVSLNTKGTYSFTAKFAGDNTYAAISKTAKLTIK